MNHQSVLRPDAESSLTHFFMTRLQHASRTIDSPPQDDTLWYLSTLLDRFGRSEALFSFEDGQVGLRPLALLYGDAREASNEYQRCLLLRQLGDLALFLGALFPGCFQRRGIHQDYVIGMGSSAYDYLGDNARRNRHIFAELATRFAQALQMIARSCERTEQMNAKEILAVYRRWEQDGDQDARRRLEALGITLDRDQRPN